MESVKVLADFIVKQSCPGAGWASGFAVRVAQDFDVIMNLSRYGARPIQAAERIFTNGPAIKGGCVTRRKHRAESWYFSREAVTVRGEYGVSFAVKVQGLWARVVSRYKVDVPIYLSPVTKLDASQSAIAV
jgi:hypothetical protein